MKTTTRILLVMMISLSLTMAPGHAGEKKMPQSGFLSDYSLLKPEDPLGVVDWLYVNKEAVFGAYDKIMLDQAVFFFKKEADYKGIHTDELVELSDAIHKAILDALSDVYTFTDKPGPGVMRIRAAITDVVPYKPGRGTLTSVVPVGIAASLVKKAATGTHIGVGGVSFEAELLDSQTNAVLGAVIDSQTGKKYKVGKTTSKFGHAKDIFNLWAKTLRKRLDNLSGRK